MKNLSRTIGMLLSVLFVVLAAGSCVKETALDGPGIGSEDGEKTVTFAMRVPTNDDPRTRALGSAQEDEVDEVHVLVLHPFSGNVYKHEVATASGAQSGSRRLFEVTLPVGKYHIAIVANAEELIRSKYPDGIDNGTTMESVRQNLMLARQQAMADVGDRAEDKWNTTVDASKAYLIPMWGQISNVDITETPATDQHIGTVNVYRMVAKIDVRIPRADKYGTAIIPAANFEFTAARLYNYNTKGYVIPVSTNGNWEQSGGGKASAASVVPAAGNFVNGDNKYQQYTAIVDDYNVPAGDVANASGLESALIGEIYTFEVGAGSDYTTRPCVIIGGKWKGKETWYRVDMISSATGDHLELRRNHRYVVWVKAIKGPGYEKPEEAYKSKPINLEAEVIEWDESSFLEGVWNGNHYIKFTTLDVNFSQFGTSTPYEVTVKSDLPDLKFNGFLNTPGKVGDGDTGWSESGTRTWSNGHFTVEASTPTEQGGEYIYTLSITANPTSKDDPARHSSFKIVGANLEATFNIRQDVHVPFVLETNPANDGLIRCWGESQRVPISIQSTHNYAITLSSTEDMFGLVYTSPEGSEYISDLKNIDKSIKTVYVNVQQQTQGTPRVGTVSIAHETSENSNAEPSVITIFQVHYIISAQITTGDDTYKATVMKQGGQVEIEVRSNISAWIPVLTRKVGGSEIVEDLSGSLGDYFSITNGSGNQIVNFKITTPLLNTALDDDIYYIYFKDANGETITTPVIQITHTLGYRGFGTRNGVLAPRGILAVDKDKVLNLDGPDREDNYIVYFKFGSTVALSAGNGINGDAYDNEDIAWLPDGFATDPETMNSWTDVPYLNNDGIKDEDYVPLKVNGKGVIDYTTARNDLGIGDPCRLATKGGTVGNYRMPTGHPHENISSDPTWMNAPNSFGEAGIYDDQYDQFYPAAGIRVTDGGFAGKGSQGQYRSGTVVETWRASILMFSSSTVNLDFVQSGTDRARALPIRCVPAE